MTKLNNHTQIPGTKQGKLPLQCVQINMHALTGLQCGQTQNCKRRSINIPIVRRKPFLRTDYPPYNGQKGLSQFSKRSILTLTIENHTYFDKMHFLIALRTATLNYS